MLVLFLPYAEYYGESDELIYEFVLKCFCSHFGIRHFELRNIHQLDILVTFIELACEFTEKCRELMFEAIAFEHRGFKSNLNLFFCDELVYSC